MTERRELLLLVLFGVLHLVRLLPLAGEGLRLRSDSCRFVRALFFAETLDSSIFLLSFFPFCFCGI